MVVGVIEHKSYARVGLLGNPSDVYYGKTLSFSIGNFWASVRLEPSQNLVIVPHPTHDLVQFNSITHLVNRLQSEGYYGGVRLLMAICKKFHNYCKNNNITLREGNFTLSYDTNIPRQTGLSGSSAIVTAALNCLLDFYEVRHVIKVEVRPNLVLNAEKELGIVAGLQDRVAQIYGGLVYMDFGKNHMDEFDHGIYTPMDIGLLPSLYLIYAENPSDSGKVHSTVRQRWLAGDEFIISTMEEVANLALEGQKALLVKDYAKLATLMNHNFDLRRRMFGDEALGAVNIEMIEVARKVGAASKFTGSGGAVVVFCPDGPSQVKQLKDACQQAGFIFRPIEVMPSYLKDIDLQTLTSNQMRKAPPVATKVRHEMELFGDVRVDNYYWLRDDSRSNPEVLSYLQEENAYTDSVMSGTKQLEDCIYSEIRGRVKEDDISAPMRKGPYYYYTRNLAGKEYVQHCRRHVPNATAPTSVYDTMPTGSDAPPEHIILDENVKALEHTYYKIDAFRVSPNNKLVAYAEDTKGDEIYTVYVIDAESGVLVGKPLVGVITSDLEWAGDEALVYITMDHEILRPDKVWLHKLGTEQSDDICLYHEKDEKFSLFLEASESKKYLFVASKSKITRSVFYLDTSNPENGLVVLTPRMSGIDTSASHRGNHFFIKRRSDECFNSELLVCPVEDTSATTLLLPHRPSVKLQNIQLFTDHLAVHERENGLPRIIVYRLPAFGAPLERLQGGRAVDFVDPVYSVDPLKSQFESSVLRFSYSSLRTPSSVFDYDMDTGVSVLKKTETLMGGFDASNYVTERKWATAADGIQIPISLVYQKDLVKLDGSDPLLLYGYGSYEICKNPTFNASWLSLLDRGFICALAHIRGGGEMGRQWYENGKLLKKKNTFTDFIACAEYLIDNKYCSKERLCIHGRSAGGLLIGAVLDMRPDLFKAVVAGVPFVDVVTTMLDSTIPLTTSEWEEWGDPRKEEFYFYMKSYSPVDNVKAQNYPHILITTGLNDPRVMYFEPAKFVAKLRDMKTDDNLLLFKCEMGAGHFSKSGRFQKLQEEAFTYTFILKALNML